MLYDSAREKLQTKHAMHGVSCVLEAALKLAVVVNSPESNERNQVNFCMGSENISRLGVLGGLRKNGW